MSGDLIGWALGYAGLGWPVLPLRPRAKVPTTPHGLRDATTDPDVLRGWWERWPAAGIGLTTGHAFDVLDIDGGVDVWDRFEGAAPHDEWDVTGPIVLTARGIHIYVAATGRGNRAGLLPSVDWRGRGGYVVAPPSVHPSGHVYSWDPTRRPGTTPGPVPAWLLDLIDGPRTPPRPPAAHVAGEGTVYGRRALDAELGRLAPTDVGRRNDELVRAAFRLGQLVAGGELDARNVASALLTVADRIGLGETEAVATIRSGLAGGMRTPRRAPEVRR
ncbi:MAG: bifunctional DNA primase/polymerase [Iamia sp.]